MPGPDPGRAAPVPVVSVPEIRDYSRINGELVTLLDAGHRRIRLAGAGGHRLLAFGLRGAWSATVEIDGHAGPELAAEVDAPGLVIRCAGSAAEGAGRGLRAGRLVIAGAVGPAVGYAQYGGTIVVAGSAGARAGLDRTGGLLFVAGDLGRLAGERQAGGLILAGGAIGPHPGIGRRGGRLLRLADAAEDDREALRREALDLGPAWPDGLPIPGPVA